MNLDPVIHFHQPFSNVKHRLRRVFLERMLSFLSQRLTVNINPLTSLFFKILILLIYQYKPLDLTAL